MTAAVVALFAEGPTTLRNIGSWRVKETDRIAAMALLEYFKSKEAAAIWQEARVFPVTK